MEAKFAIVIQRQRLIGWVLTPFEIVREEGKDFFEPVEYLLPESNKKYTEPHYKKLVSLIARYDDKQLFKKFSKKKKDIQKDFLEKVKDEYFKDEIRPYIESVIADCIPIIKKHSIPIYIREEEANLYQEDELYFKGFEPNVLFTFTKTDLGLNYSLDVIENKKIVNLLGKRNILLSNSPGVLVVNHEIYLLNKIDAKKLLPFFNKEEIHIPVKFVQQYFDTFVLNSIRHHSVKAHGFSILNEYNKPNVSARIVRDSKNHACIELTFDYGKWKVTDAFLKQKYYVQYENVEGNPKYTRIHRDNVFEKTCVNLLTSKGLVAENAVWKLESYNADGYYEMLQWIQNNKNTLDSVGIDVFDESTDKKVQNLEAEISITINSDSIDWFDIHAVVKFGDFEIPFKKLRKNILNQDPVVLLPDNKIGIIPYEWFAKYRELFLFSVKNNKEDVFSLKTIHYKTIQRLPVEIEDEVKTRFLHIDTNGAKDNALPEEVNADLRPYQVEGYRWLYFLYANNFGGCLADDMGLGKTLQTITLLQKVINLHIAHAQPKTSLILCPASIVHNWYNEFKKFTPGLKVFKYVGNERNKDFDYFNDYDIVLTTYGLLRNDIESFEKYDFSYTVLDESQIIKNPNSKIYSAVLRLKSDHKLVLTGTPIENTLIDLWAQMNFVNRDMLGNLNAFKENFLKVPDYMKPQVEQQLRRIVNPFIFRREKQMVAKDLPSLTEQVRMCKMTDDQSKLYESEKSKVRNMIYESIENNTFQKSTINVLRALMRLRQIANHPELAEGETGTSGKFDEVIRVLDTLTQSHKVLIFSSFVKHLELFKEYFKQKKINHVTLTGSTNNREKVIKEFQENDDCKVFLISIKAGGVGLNLTEADYVFILDPWWNPAVENQAVSRAHRIGQKNKVNVYRFITENTIEEKIKSLQAKKAQLARSIVSSENSIPFSQEEVSFLVE